MGDFQDDEKNLEFPFVKSEIKNIWIKGIKLIDFPLFKPTLILELDDENLIIKLKSRKVDVSFSRRAHSYIEKIKAMKVNDKDVSLLVVSPVEKSKLVSYEIDEFNTLQYKVIGNDHLDGKKILDEIEEKYKHEINITRKECIYFSIAPLMVKNGNLEKNLEKTVNILINLTDAPSSTKNLCFGIQWLLVDKYVLDEQLRNSLFDLLGEKMSAVDEYGKRKEEKGRKEGIKEIIMKLQKSMGIDEISEKTGMDIVEIEELLD